MNNIGNIRTAIEFAKADAQTSFVKGSPAGGGAFSVVNRKYLAKVPTDPQGKNFKYCSDSTTALTKYQISSSLEKLDDVPATLGSYGVGNAAQAAIAGNFVATATNKYINSNNKGCSCLSCGN